MYGRYWQYFGVWVCSFACLKGVAKSDQVLFTGIEAVLVLTLRILRWQAVLSSSTTPESTQGSNVPHEPTSLPEGA